MMSLNFSPNSSPLGKTSNYPNQYDPKLLFPMARAEKRRQIGIANKLPFEGIDIWHAYEISWLNAKGKPVVSIGRFIFDASSEYIIESKSLKLYLNSFNGTKFDNQNIVANIMAQDLSQKANTNVKVELFSIEDKYLFAKPKGICLDGLEIDMPHTDDVDNSLLVTSNFSNNSSSIVE